MALTQYRVAGRTAKEISTSVERGIRDGALSPGAAMPSVRSLAAVLEVAPGTVASAYRALRDAGLVQSAGRRGTQVRARPSVAPRSAAPLPSPPGTVDLSTGEPDPTLLPALGPALAQLSTGPAAGPAQRTVARLMELGRARLRADGVPADAVTVTSGALDGIDRVLTAHLRAGDTVAVEDPGWPNLLDLVAGLGLRVAPVRVDEDGPRPDGLARALRAGARGVLVTSRAQNPTGAAVTPARGEQLRAVLAEHPQTLLVEDDHAAELSGVPLVPLAACTQSWAFVRSVSKPYGPDLRLAVVSGDDTTISRVQGRMQLAAGWVSTVLQHLVLALWSHPDVSRTIELAAGQYTERRHDLLQALAERGVDATGRTGINVWVPVSDETTVVARLLTAGYVVAPGARFRVASPPGVRITVSPLGRGAVPRLAAAVAVATAAGISPGYRA